MNSLKMVLNDSIEIAIREFAIPMHAIVECANEDEVMSIWKQLTTENLVKLDITLDGEVMMQYRYAGLNGVQSIINADGTVTAHIYMDGEKVPLNEEEIEYINAAKILLGEDK